MKNFIFKSAEADLQKMFQYLETAQQNILYITYRMDTLTKDMRKLVTDKGLQKQVDEYFEEGASVGLEDTRETSHQTDSEEQ